MNHWMRSKNNYEALCVIGVGSSCNPLGWSMCPAADVHQPCRFGLSLMHFAELCFVLDLFTKKNKVVIKPKKSSCFFFSFHLFFSAFFCQNIAVKPAASGLPHRYGPEPEG